MFRINLSHTKYEDLKRKIKFLKKNIGINKICIDTEGAQIRTGKIVKPKKLEKNQVVTLGFNNIAEYTLYPHFEFNELKVGTKVQIGFDDLVLNVVKKSNKIIKCKVMQSGLIESNKGVHFDTTVKLNTLTDKDVKCINLAVKLGVKNFALSFANKPSDIQKIRKLIKKNCKLYFKNRNQKRIKKFI